MNMVNQSPSQIWVHKNRTTTIQLALGYDASAETFTSQIREEKDNESDLICEWTIEPETDGTDGLFNLTIDNSVASTEAVTGASTGWMDVKRVTGGEPRNVFDEPVEVLFKEVITT